MYLSISFKVASLALGQSYDCPSANEVTMKDTGNINPCITKTKNICIYSWDVICPTSNCPVALSTCSFSSPNLTTDSLNSDSDLDIIYSTTKTQELNNRVAYYSWNSHKKFILWMHKISYNLITWTCMLVNLMAHLWVYFHFFHLKILGKILATLGTKLHPFVTPWCVPSNLMYQSLMRRPSMDNIIRTQIPNMLIDF